MIFFVQPEKLAKPFQMPKKPTPMLFQHFKTTVRMEEEEMLINQPLCCPLRSPEYSLVNGRCALNWLCTTYLLTSQSMWQCLQFLKATSVAGERKTWWWIAEVKAGHHKGYVRTSKYRSQREQICKAAGSEDLPSLQYTFEDVFLQPGWSWSHELHTNWHLDCTFQFTSMQKESNSCVQGPLHNVNQSMIIKEDWEMHCVLLHRELCFQEEDDENPMPGEELWLWCVAVVPQLNWNAEDM